MNFVNAKNALLCGVLLILIVADVPDCSWYPTRKYRKPSSAC